VVPPHASRPSSFSAFSPSTSTRINHDFRTSIMPRGSSSIPSSMHVRPSSAPPSSRPPSGGYRPSAHTFSHGSSGFSHGGFAPHSVHPR
jgi:hypothetical protein